MFSSMTHNIPNLWLSNYQDPMDHAQQIQHCLVLLRLFLFQVVPPQREVTVVYFHLNTRAIVTARVHSLTRRMGNHGVH